MKKNLLYILCAAALIGWVGFRIHVIVSENSRVVFNVARVTADTGIPAETLVVHKKTGVLKEPLSIKNNRALVSLSRINKFRVGQKVGDGTIVSVSNRIDLDSGMYVITTRGVSDGLNYAESINTGFFIPIQAINNNTVIIAVDGVGQKHEVKISDQDSEYALVSSGLSDGDTVILSKTDADKKIKL